MSRAIPWQYCDEMDLRLARDGAVLQAGRLPMNFDDWPLHPVASLDAEASGGRHTAVLAQTEVGPVVEVSEDHGHGQYRRRLALSTMVHVILNLSDEELWKIESRGKAHVSEEVA